MGYDIHIKIGDSWVDEEDPLTLENVRQILPMLSSQFRIDESGVITTSTPQGQTLSGDFGPYLEYAYKIPVTVAADNCMEMGPSPGDFHFEDFAGYTI